jgi:fatty-acyl-CoA synthase
MAAIVTDNDLDLAGLREDLAGRLPSYARPVFLRVARQAEITGTFKYSKTELLRQGYDPATATDPLYFDHPGLGAFVRVDEDLYDRIQSGGIRL